MINLMVPGSQGLKGTAQGVVCVDTKLEFFRCHSLHLTQGHILVTILTSGLEENKGTEKKERGKIIILLDKDN